MKNIKKIKKRAEYNLNQLLSELREIDSGVNIHTAHEKGSLDFEIEVVPSDGFMDSKRIDEVISSHIPRMSEEEEAARSHADRLIDTLIQASPDRIEALAVLIKEHNKSKSS